MSAASNSRSVTLSPGFVLDGQSTTAPRGDGGALHVGPRQVARVVAVEERIRAAPEVVASAGVERELLGHLDEERLHAAANRAPLAPTRRGCWRRRRRCRRPRALGGVVERAFPSA